MGKISCCGLIVIILCFLIGYSFNIVEVDEQGLKQNEIDQIMEKNGDSQYWPSGRQLTYLGRFFVRQPRLYQGIEFSGNVNEANLDSLWCWSKDGQNITIDFSFQMSIDPKKIQTIQKNHEFQWHAVYSRLAHTTIKNTTTQFNTLDFFTQRFIIKQTLEEKVAEAFTKKNGGAVILRSFQLRKVVIPGQFEEEIRQKLIQQQKVKTSEQTMEVNIKNKEMELVNKKADMDIQQLQQDVVKNTARDELINQYEMDKKQTINLMKAIQGLCNTNSINTQTQVLKMFYLWLLRTKTAKLKLLQMVDPTLLIDTKDVDKNASKKNRPINVTCACNN